MECGMQPEVVIVGGGPVGLFTAIQIKLNDPNTPILILEKHQHYERTHGLSLKVSSFVGAPDDARLQKLIKELPLSIRTNDLEERLLTFALQLGIEVNYKNLTNVGQIKEEYPSANFIIGADGTHSVVRSNVFPPLEEEQMGFVAEIKYDIDGHTRLLNELTDGGPAEKYSKHFVYEYIGDEVDGRSPVTIRFFIDKDTYESMHSANFAHPLHLQDDNKIDASLFISMKNWLGAREILAGEKRIPNSEKITVTSLPFYASKSFVTSDAENPAKKYFVVGDAAFGVPYFRGLHNGIRCSVTLAKCFHALKNNQLINDKSPIDAYTSFMEKIINEEKALAFVENKDVFLRQSHGLDALIKDMDNVVNYLDKNRSNEFLSARLKSLTKLLQAPQHAEDIRTNIDYVIRDLSTLIESLQKTKPTVRKDNIHTIVYSLIGGLIGYAKEKSIASVSKGVAAASLFSLFKIRKEHSSYNKKLKPVKTALDDALAIKQTLKM